MDSVLIYHQTKVLRTYFLGTNFPRTDFLKSKGADIMKNIIIAIVIGLAVLSPFNLTNSYLRTSEFDTVILQHGESIETIASRYTSDNEQLQELTVAIKEINDIKNDRDLRAGRKLQIPVIADDNQKVQVASR
ncbi:MAG TPA: hypothetical protein DCR09_03700 [Anaerovibrio sp.]|nr:LysM peptidoglycan-binding domain-containing protein [Anaerovibrio lipolyticus]HAF31489.1 hypothetical protein [Anaerovibrio sp.]HAQ55468.1 hypothetical protein [Anaerovibrio sp.]HCP95518.1 hypothetical protein [Anaerovibrio sp.]